jgi:hypothetical protein
LASRSRVLECGTPANARVSFHLPALAEVNTLPAMLTVAEKAFYDKQLGRLPPEVFDEAAAEKAMRTPGDRYFCLLDRIRYPSSLQAVEWGFGNMSRLAVLTKMFKSYTALDIATEAVIGNNRFQADIRNCNLNVDLDIPSETFDVSIAMMVIEHLFDPFHSFREIARITKSSGLVFVNLPLVTGIKNRARLLFGQLPVTSAAEWWQYQEWDGGHLHYFNMEHVRRLGATYGLQLERTYPVGRFSKLKRVAPTLLCSELSFVFRKAI